MKNLFLKISLMIASLLCCTVIGAQTVKGTVTDADALPVPGAAVMLQGSTLGVVTDAKGAYSISVPDASKAVLLFSCIGLRTEAVNVNGRAVVNVQLLQDNNFLEETVVIGYATVKRRDLMGAVTSVDNKTLTAVPVSNVTEALAGKMAGVQVTSTEGDPDAEIKIRVRGGGSITQDSSPLYIVDGFPVESISDIPASDIQSIDVLKDAFSTAIYGSRGANGVVLVTTKDAAAGKISVSYNVYYGRKKMANKDAITVMSPGEFVKTQYEVAMLNDKYDTEYVPYFGSFADIDLYRNLQGNDWVQQAFGNVGSTFSHNLTVSGSADKTKWTLSYAHIGDNAIMTGSNYVRDNLNFKSRFNPVKALTFDVNARYSNTEVRGAGANSISDSGSQSSNGRLKHAVQYTPIPLNGISTDSDLEEDYGDNAPPMQSIADNDNLRERKNWTVGAALTWHIIPNLDLKIEGGLDDYQQANNRFYGLTTYFVANNSTVKGTPTNQYTNVFRKKYRNTNTLNYNFKNVIKDKRHKFDLLLGEEYIYTKSNTLSGRVDGLPDFFDAQMAWNIMASGTAAELGNNYNLDDKLLSFFGRANYDFDGRYSLSATMRADGSSKFSKGNQWGIFPSVAAAWTISNEKWLKNAGWLDNLKLRYSYGTAGNNNIPSGVSSMTYGANATTWVYGTNTYWTTTKVGGKSIMPNTDLTWETTVSHNLGLDFSLLHRRVNGSLELYSNTTRNLLIQFPTAGSGYDYQFRNMGSVANRGYEASVNLVLVEKKNFGLTVGGNISINTNEVTSLGGLKRIDAETGWGSTEVGVDYVVMEGQPLGAMYGYTVDGIYSPDEFTYSEDNGWQSVYGSDYDKSVNAILGANYYRPGALKIKDTNKDGKINDDDKSIIGCAQPKGLGGFNINAYAGGFDFAANFNYVFGNSIYNANKVEFTSTRKYFRRNLLTSMETAKRWTNVNWESGELITDPDELAAANKGVTMWSPGIQKAVFTDWAVEDGSFLRLSSVTLGYTFPEELTRKIHIQKLRAYITGTNLFCLTSYSGYDPEVDTRRATPLTPGCDYSAYPKSRGFVAGLNITF